MRLVEIRLLEGPNVYRLEPVVKLEVAVGRRRTWYGQRDPGRHALVRLGATVPAARVAGRRRRGRRLGPAAARRTTARAAAGLAVHRSSDPGHWIVTFPWTGAERARDARRGRARARRARRLAVADRAADRRARRGSSRAGRERHRGRPHVTADLDPRRRPADPGRLDHRAPTARRTVTRLITHILIAGRAPRRHDDLRRRPRRRADGRAGRLDRARRRAADPRAARHRRRRPRDRPRRDRAARASATSRTTRAVLTNVSSDHLDLQGIHTLPELAEVKATIARITRPDGWVVLNGDDPLVAAVARRVAPTSRCSRSPRRPPAGVGPAPSRARAAGPISSRDGWLVEVEGEASHRIVEVARRPDHDRRAGPPQRRQRAGGRRRGARRWARRSTQVARGPAATSGRRRERSPGRLNLFRLGCADRHRRLRPQRGRASRPSSTSPRASPAGAAGRAAPITAIIGTAGDRPDDTLRGHRPDRGRAAQRVAIKETPQVPARPDRGIGRRRAPGRRDRRRRHGRRDVPIYASETPRSGRS